MKLNDDEILELKIVLWIVAVWLFFIFVFVYFLFLKNTLLGDSVMCGCLFFYIIILTRPY